MSDLAPATSLPLGPDVATDVRAAPRVALHSAVGVSRYYLTFIMAAGFPAVTGLLLYGWRALLILLIILPVTFGAAWVWRRIGARGRQLHPVHTLYLAILLWLVLPAHLLQSNLWPIVVAAPILLIILTWLLGGVGSGRIHPVIATYLLLVVAFDPLLVPTAVLQRFRTFTGDLARAAPPAPPAHAYMKDGYLKTPHVEGADALQLEPASTRLFAFTSGQKRPGRSWISIDALLRDELPPLEDLIIGGQPAPIGAACAVAVIIGGLFLLYRGIIDFRVPLSIFAGAFLALLTLPVPIRITDDGPDWRWFIFRSHRILTPSGLRYEQVGFAKALTFVNYEIMIGPMILMIFFFATAPALRPMAGRARILYGLLVGIVAAAFQLYVSISYGPYLALLIVSLLTPLLDRLFRPHPLV